MSTEPAAVPAPLIAGPSTATGESSDFDERWAAWQAKGAARDRAFRRKLAVAAPIVIAVAAVVIYTFVGR
jgi:hypothetical protein